MESCLCQVDSSFSLLNVIVAEKYSLHRLGQEPPPQQQEDSYDGRSLAEVSLSKGLIQTSRIHFLLLVSTTCVETCRK